MLSKLAPNDGALLYEVLLLGELFHPKSQQGNGFLLLLDLLVKWSKYLSSFLSILAYFLISGTDFLMLRSIAGISLLAALCAPS